jgi:hypothetical protein
LCAAADEVRRLIAATGNVKHQTALSVDYGTGRHMMVEAPPTDWRDQQALGFARAAQALSISRFGTGPWPDDELKKQASWQYRHFYGAR